MMVLKILPSLGAPARAGIRAAALSVFLLGGVTAAGAQGWTTDRIAVVVPASPGGGSDIMGRQVADGLALVVPGLTTTVENRPGGSNAVGISYVFQQRGNPEYMVVVLGSLLTGPMEAQTPYHWTDFTPLAQIAEDTLFLVVLDDSPYETLDDVIAASQESQLVEAVFAATGPAALTSRLLQAETELSSRHVVFPSSGEANPALLAGDVDFMITNPGNITGFLESGDMRLLTVFADDRHPSFPDVPTALEQGIDVVYPSWRGLVAPGGLTEEQGEFLIGALEAWTESDHYRTYIETSMLAPVIRFGDDFHDFLAEQEELLRVIMDMPVE